MPTLLIAGKDFLQAFPAILHALQLRATLLECQVSAMNVPPPSAAEEGMGTLI